MKSVIFVRLNTRKFEEILSQKLVNRRKSEFFVALVNRRKKVVNRRIEKSCDEKLLTPK